MTSGQQTECLPEWLNDELLQIAVRKAENNYTIKLLQSDVTFDTTVGDHYASTMYKVKVRVTQSLDDEDLQRDIHLLIKTQPKGELSKELMSKMGVFTREIKMFSEVLSAIRHLFNDKNCPEYEDIGAKYFHHTEDMSTLIVENISPKGFRLAERQVGLDLQHCMLVVRLLAKYHASSIALWVEKPELMDSFSKHPFLIPNKGMENWIKATLNGLSSVVLSWPNGELYSKRLKERAVTFKKDYNSILEYNPDEFNVLIHGDMWMGNILFRYNDITREVQEVRFVDFQISCLNSPAIDLQYFIHTSPKDEVRERHTEDLLREYHIALCDTLSKLGYSHKCVSFERLMKEYEKKALQAVFGGLLVFPIVAANPKDALDMETSIKDAKGDSALTNRLTGEYVTKVFKKYVPKFFEMGLI